MNARIAAEICQIPLRETHRIKQRKQYKLMLGGLNGLNSVLPNTTATDDEKVKSKQVLLSEAVQYIHYLQICIYQLGKETGTPDADILRELHHGAACISPCSCLLRVEEEVQKACLANRPPFSEIAQLPSGEGKTAGLDPIKKKMQRSSTPAKITKTSSSSQTSSCSSESSGWSTMQNPPKSMERDCIWKVSPIRSPRTGESSGFRRESYGRSENASVLRTRKRKISDTRTSPTVAHCDIITPPSSYKRTIIEDSPQEFAATHNWEKVSVRRSSSPWMPKPDNTYAGEDYEEKPVPRFSMSHNLTDEDLDVSGDFLSGSLALDSFLDSSDTEEEFAPFSGFKLQEKSKATPTENVYSPQMRAFASPIYTGQQLTPRSRDSTPLCRSQSSTNDLSSPEHLLGFSPRLFLTGRRFDCT